MTPRIPDLNRRGEYPLPGSLLLESPVPTLWGSSLLSAGSFLLSIEVRPNFQTMLRASPVDGNPAVLLPAETGTVDAPIPRVRATIASVTDEKGKSLAVVTIRWGALILEAPLTAIEQTVVEVANYRLDTYLFPDSILPSGQLIVGQLEDRRGGKPTERVICILRPGDAPTLRLEDVERARLIALRRGLERDLAVMKGRLRRLRLDPPSSDLTSLEGKISRSETRLGALNQRIDSLGEGQGWRQLPAARREGGPSPRWRAGLIEEGSRVLIELATPVGTYRYPLD